jgi:hypothetical protein
MDRTKLALIGGSLVFAVVAYWRFSAEAAVPPPRPLELMAPVSARSATPVKTAPKRASAAPAAAVPAKAAPAESRPVARAKSPEVPKPATASKVSAVSEVGATRGTARVAPSKTTPRVTPPLATAEYARRVADAASVSAEEPNRATFRLEAIAAAEPHRPEAFETLAALHLRQGDFYQAYEMFDSAIRKGGKATFSIMHDHSRGNFDKGPKDTCVGELTILPSEVTFESADGHRFASTWTELREVGSYRFFGSGIGGFHVRVAADGKSQNFNLAPRSRDKREANIILDLLIENAQRQETGK